VLTLFVIALVTLLVLEYHFDASVELDLAVNYGKDVQAYHLALAGVRFAQALLQTDKVDSDGQQDPWYQLGLVPLCFSPQQLLERATTGVGDLSGTQQASQAANDQRLAERRSLGTNQAAEGCVLLHITDENSKLPLNALKPLPNSDGTSSPPPVWVGIFQKFFESFGIDPEVVDALVDWIDEDDNPRGTGGAEKAHYTSLPIPYEPPNARMRTPAELRLVKGFDEPETLAKLFPGLPPEAVAGLDLGNNLYLTPFPGDLAAVATQPGANANAQPPGQTVAAALRPGTQQPASSLASSARVNVNTASPEVLKALMTGAQSGRSNTGTQVEDIVVRRQEKQFKNLTEAVPDSNIRAALTNVADVKSTHFRVESIGVMGAIQKKIVAVLKRGPTQASTINVANPMTIVYFKVE
jgi:type II secretory pathway component PulK